MALIKCPECGRENVSSSAVACPDCGFGIREYSEQLEYENHRKNVIVCPYCGNITGFPTSNVGSKEYESMQCSRCKNQMVHIDFTVDEFVKTVNYDAVGMASEDVTVFHKASEKLDYKELERLRNKIFYEYVEPMGKLEKDTKHYKWSLVEIGEMDSEEYHNLIISSPRNFSPVQPKENTPKCPYCGSTDLKKLSSLDRGLSTFMWGLGSNKIGKTYECRKCKSTF